ncbi:PREDICTED: pumilio homolog 15-like [Tarenaya hassleriana]|uniref:pumilio homolog 15-like n=1 Tax=Tarenaya hassleriana TaxID=28532 RepID=UPI00053C7075|nr:PREDICTED: pumilio homolog 15-like [Tarenaya hassleriana]
MAASCVTVTNAGLFDKERVEITNMLEHNKILKVHCKSDEDDLGFHLIPPGETYEIVFHDNLFDTTVFWCNLWQGPHYKHHQVLTVYDQSQGIAPMHGNRIVWEAWELGIFEHMDDNIRLLRYRWDIPHKASSPLSSVDENLSPH